MPLDGGKSVGAGDAELTARDRQIALQLGVGGGDLGVGFARRDPHVGVLHRRRRFGDEAADLRLVQAERPSSTVTAASI